MCGAHVIEYIGHSDILSEIEAEAQLCLNNIFDSLLHMQDVRICVQCTCNKMFCGVWVSVAGYRALLRNMGLFCGTWGSFAEHGALLRNMGLFCEKYDCLVEYTAILCRSVAVKRQVLCGM